MEYLNVYDGNGIFLNKVVERSKVNGLNKNEHIAVSVIFIENDQGEFLIQKNSSQKGGKFSSTGGHVIEGETPIESIKREVLEELGININEDNIMQLGYICYDMPLRYMFYLKKDIKIEDVVVQKEEVDYCLYMTKEDISNLIEDNLITESHGVIFKSICQYLDSL